MLFFPCGGKLKIHFRSARKQVPERGETPFPGRPLQYGKTTERILRKGIPVQSTIQTHTHFALSNIAEP